MSAILPSANTLAEEVRDTSIEHVADLYEVTVGGVQKRLNLGGYTKHGTPSAPPRGPSVPTYLGAPDPLPDTSWMSGRGCADADPEDFYPETRGSGKSAREAAAKEICAGCNVRLKCLEWALVWDAATAGESWGIHGGMNGQERDQLRRQRVGGAA